jgi:hypothetical protein
MKTYLKTLFASLFAICLTACSNDDDKTKPLQFEKTSYEARIKTTTGIDILGGSRNLSVTIEHPEILDATIKVYESREVQLMIDGKQKGKTEVSIKDNETDEVATLTIKVTDLYIPFCIFRSNHPALAEGLVFYLVKDEKHSCYFARPDAQGYEVFTQGTYDFQLKSDEYSSYLTLYYSEDEGKFTEATIAPSPHRFDITDNSSTTFHMINTIFLDKNDKANRSIQPIILNMKGVDSNYEVEATLLRNETIQEGILE